jgi:hypothetical protein
MKNKEKTKVLHKLSIFTIFSVMFAFLTLDI